MTACLNPPFKDYPAGVNKFFDFDTRAFVALGVFMRTIDNGYVCDRCGKQLSPTPDGSPGAPEFINAHLISEHEAQTIKKLWNVK